MAQASSLESLNLRVRIILFLLLIQFALGMAVNLIGTDSSLGKTWHDVFLGLHALLAIGLVVNASIGMHYALKQGGQWKRRVRGATGAIGLAFVAGVLTLVAPGANWWSYLMALAFIGAFAQYGLIYVKLQQQ